MSGQLNSPSFFLTEALHFAEPQLGFCAPNPSVGAVLVKEGKIVGKGAHHGPGTAHAEVEAIHTSGINDFSNCTLYVTLEPCCHFGRTPPCTDLILEKKIPRVYYAFSDPNPVVAGKGAQKLKENGVEVILEPVAEIDNFYRPYSHWTSTGLPFVTAKIAITADGKYALTGRRLIISGSEANALTHEERLKHDAILTTVATVLADNPRLTARAEGKETPKKVFILDPNLETPLTSEVFRDNKVTLLTAPQKDLSKIERIRTSGVEVLSWSSPYLLAPWFEILSILGTLGLHSVWVEAGGNCFRGLLGQKAAQRALVYRSSNNAPNEAKLLYVNGFSPELVAPHFHKFTKGTDEIYEFLW